MARPNGADSDGAASIAERIRRAIDGAGLRQPGEDAVTRLGIYVSLMLRWNARLNLTAIRDEDGIIARHIVESVEIGSKLPGDIETLLDFGSGAGLPGIPIAICRPEIAVTLAESQSKKAAFLMEAVRTLGLTSRVYAGRAEEIGQRFDCVTLRAVDKMAAAVRAAEGLVKPGGYLALMTTSNEAKALKAAAGAGFNWSADPEVGEGDSRVICIGKKGEG
jgi:16S rRNA (guanine527-N7)-methyltransferase